MLRLQLQALHVPVHTIAGFHLWQFRSETDSLGYCAAARPTRCSLSLPVRISCSGVFQTCSRGCTSCQTSTVFFNDPAMPLGLSQCIPNPASTGSSSVRFSVSD